MILDGKELSEKILSECAQKVRQLKTKPKLAVIQVGNNIASSIYVKKKQKTAQSLGMESLVINLKKDVSEAELIFEIQKLNNDPTTHAILVQLPLPKHIDVFKIQDAIDFKKDVDGFAIQNIGAIAKGQEPIAYPCTPKGIIKLLEKYEVEIGGKHAVVVGRSNIVGRPIASMLLNKDATVTICHSKTKNLGEITKTADILIAAVGMPEFIESSMLKKGVCIIDVGINRLDSGRITGDVDFESARSVASYITPVPGGVGPMTIAMLMENTIELCEKFGS